MWEAGLGAVRKQCGNCSGRGVLHTSYKPFIRAYSHSLNFGVSLGAEQLGFLKSKTFLEQQGCSFGFPGPQQGAPSTIDEMMRRSVPQKLLHCRPRHPTLKRTRSSEKVKVCESPTSGSSTSINPIGCGPTPSSIPSSPRRMFVGASLTSLTMISNV